MIGNAFKKYLKQNSFWLKKAFADAVAYGKTHQPRILPTDHNQTIFTMFGENVWPALKLRGWQEDENDDGVFVHQSVEYKSPSEAMLAAIRLHPDISDLIQQTLKKLEEARLESDKINNRQLEKDLSLTVSTADINALEDFLKKYGSIQLFTERTRSRRSPKMLMGKRFLASCQYVSAASELVMTAERSKHLVKNNDSYDDPLIRHIAVDERTNLPCSGWTPKHDAILVRAIAKHGWLDIDRSLNKIVNDQSITWGPPFEKVEDNPMEGKPKSPPDSRVAEVQAVAKRTAAILNEHEETFTTSKGFNKDLLAKIYSLIRSSADPDRPEDKERWATVDSSQSKKSAEEIDDEEDSDGVTDLPAKKLLLTRAKKVMHRPLDVLSEGGVLKVAFQPFSANGSAGAQDKKDEISHNYAVIDQDNDCNLLIVQLLRFIINTHPGSHTAAHVVAFDLAEKEIGINLEKSSADDQAKWKMIFDQISLARREITKTSVVSQGKNILRVMIGDQPKALKAGPLFPVEIDEKENIQNGVSIRGNKRVIKKSAGEKTEAEKAIARALKKATDTNDGNNTFGNSADKSALGLQLTLGEVTMLCAMCSEGIPLSSVEKGKGDVLLANRKTWKDFSKSWLAIVNEQYAVAEKLVDQCNKALIKAQAKNTQAHDVETLAVNLAKAEKTLKDREEALNIVKVFENDLEGLAKKGMMLVECVRRSGFGLTSSVDGKATHKFENFLGPKIPVWFKNELDKAFREEGLRTPNGRPLAIITADVAKGNAEHNDSVIGAFLDKKGARQITSQIALMTRLQSILRANNEEGFRKKIDRAMTGSARFKEAWDNKPKWWDDSSENHNHTFMLLTRLGEHGFAKVMTTTEATAGFGDPNDENQTDVGTLKDVGLSKPIIQQRANQLVRELHQIEESEKVIRRFDRRSLDSLASLPSTPSAALSSSAEKQKKATKQTDMTSFFQRKSSGKKKKSSSVLSVETGDNDLRRVWRKSTTVSSDSPDSLASVGKRKDRTETSQDGGSSNSLKDNDVVILDGDDDDENDVPSPSDKKKAKNDGD